MATATRGATSGARAIGKKPEAAAPPKAASTSSAAVRAAAVQGPPRVNLDAPAAAAPEPVGAKLAADEIDLSTGELAIPEPIAASVKEDKDLDLKVRLPGLAEGTLRVRKRGPSFHTVGAEQAILLRHRALARFSASNPTVLVLTVKENKVGGWVGLGTPGPAKGNQRSLLDAMANGADLLQWAGLSKLTFPSIHNTFEGGVIAVGVENFGFTVGGFLSGSGSVALDNKALSFDGSAKVEIPGGSGGELRIKQDPTGALSGTLNIVVQIGSVSGTVSATLSRGFVSIMGQVAYSGDRLSGKVTLAATDEPTARDITLAKPAAGGDVPIELPGPDKPAKPGKRAFCGWGQLTFRVTDWLAGAATVIINSKGQATIVGEIAPPKEFILFEQKEWIKKIVKLEIRAGYGIPVVGQVGLFANIGLDAIAKIGPGKLYNIKLQGAYSTDPRVAKNLSIEGTLNISAFAGLRLRAEAGLVVTILGHDIKAGVGLNAIAGVRGYVEATPRIGMRELAPGGKREYYIQGHLEIAAQPVLGFSGDLFVAIETPWWSPLSDKRWTWPLFSIEYPLPGEFGIGADVDYVLGSKQWPKIAFGEVNFDSSKFMTDVMNDNTDSGSGGEKKKQGEWAEGPGGKGKGGAKNKGGAGKGAGGAPGEVHPIGENISFSDGFESHNLWFEEKGSDATLMLASTKKKVVDRLDDLDKEEGVLRPKDRSKAKAVRGKARQQAKKADEPADKAAAMNLASRKAADAHKKHGSKKGAKGKKDDVKQTNKKAAEAERVLGATLKEVLHISAKRKFDPIKRTVKMHKGTERVEILPAAKKPQLKIAGKPNGDMLAEIYKHLASALNESARDAVNAKLKQVLTVVKAIDDVPVVGGQVARVAYEDLEKAADRIEKAIAGLGATLRVENLARALKMPIFKPPIRVVFQISATPNKRYHENFRAAMKDQLDSQERQLNAFNIDRWVARVDVFKSKSYDWFKKLDREARPAVAKEISAKLNEAMEDLKRRESALEKVRTKLEKLTDSAPPDNDALQHQVASLKLEEEALLRELRRARNLEPARLRLATFLEDNPTLNDLGVAQAKRFIAMAKRAKVVGRSGDEKLWKEIHTAAIREIVATRSEKEDWEGLRVTKVRSVAPLHSPDQVASGHGKIADITPVKKPASTTDAKAWKAWNDYVAKVREFVGPAWINSIIGGSWGNAIVNAKKDVVKAYPPPTFPLWMMNLALGWVQKG